VWLCLIVVRVTSLNSVLAQSLDVVSSDAERAVLMLTTYST